MKTNLKLNDLIFLDQRLLYTEVVFQSELLTIAMKLPFFAIDNAVTSKIIRYLSNPNNDSRMVI